MWTYQKIVIRMCTLRIKFKKTYVRKKCVYAIDPSQRKNFKKASILLGTNYNEGHYFIIYYLTEIFKKEVNFTKKPVFQLTRIDSIFCQLIVFLVASEQN